MKSIIALLLLLAAMQTPAEDASEGNYELTQFYDLSKPGIYSIQFLYEEYQTGWQGQL